MATSGSRVAEGSRTTPASSSVGCGLTCDDEPVTSPISCRDTFSQNIRRLLFNRFQILRSSPFRLGLFFWLLFTSCFSLGLFAFHETVHSELLGRIDDAISARFQQAINVYVEEGVDEFIAVAEHKSALPMTSSMGFQLSTANGERVAGNVPAIEAQAGWSVLTGKELGLADDESVYRFYTGEVGDYVFSLGKSLDDVAELRHVALNTVTWMLVVSTILSFGVALLVAQRVQKRLSDISVAMNDVAAGNLLSRLPVTSAGDDIDTLSEKINLSLDRLKLTVDGMRQVSTDIAHDLKTPLNRLFITIEEASRKSREGHCVGDDLEVALDEAKSINETFEALLRIAQIEAGARKSQFKRVDLKDVLETAAEVYAAVVEENGQTLSTDIRVGKDGVSLPMFGDRSLLMQMVVNLIENSVTHCAPGTAIVLRGFEGDSTVGFSVSDSGPGIPADKRNQVFQRLYRLERSRTSRGTGLGLSLVKAIGDLHGGVIELSDNEPGLSVKVIFTLSTDAVVR